MAVAARQHSTSQRPTWTNTPSSRRSKVTNQIIDPAMVAAAIRPTVSIRSEMVTRIITNWLQTQNLRLAELNKWGYPNAYTRLSTFEHRQTSRLPTIVNYPRRYPHTLITCSSGSSASVGPLRFFAALYIQSVHCAVAQVLVATTCVPHIPNSRPIGGFYTSVVGSALLVQGLAEAYGPAVVYLGSVHFAMLPPLCR